MKNLKFACLLIFIIFLTACGKDDASPHGNAEDQLQIVEVEIIVPEKAEVGEELTFQANITQNGKEVDDADSVQFEISNKGETKDVSEMIAYTNQEGGSYSINYAFKKDGIYEVQVHVDARNMHVMPVREIQVGDVTADSDSGEHSHHEGDSEGHSHDEGNSEGHSHDEGNSEGHSHHGENSVTVHLSENTYKAGEETELKIELSKDGSPFTEADVRFEIWKTEADQHDWVDATESSPGEYSSTHVFADGGTYVIKTHVKHSDGTHAHAEEEIEVK